MRLVNAITKTITGGTAAAAAFVLMAATAQASPLLGSGSALQTGPTSLSGVEKAAYRRCWIRNGTRYCRWVDDGYGYYDYGYGGPYYGYGPGVGFSFGGRGGHFHGGHFHGGGHHR
jgi:hypothetical protein